MRLDQFSAIALAAMLLAACGTPHNVLFVTATQIGIGADTATQTANIGYDRHEGVISPVYDEGDAPPVYARLESDLSILAPKIKQLYATGDAAMIAVQRMAVPDIQPLKTNDNRKKRLMVFATGTNWGLQTVFRQQGMASMSLGYKRAEVSFIPLSPKSNPKDGDEYASVLAAIDVGANVEDAKSAGYSTSQFFATGDAAKKIAERTDIQSLFGDATEKALTGEVGTFDATDPNVALLRDFANDKNNDFENFKRLESWIKEKKITSKSGTTPPSVLQFVSSKFHKFDRARAVNHFRLGG